jgi:two-component system phosphate regulon response regulator OmpR
MTHRILIIDDDTALSGMLAEYLGAAGLDVRTRGTAREGLAELAAHGADALVLDVMLPDADGLDVCRRLRAEGDVPIVMLTARGEDTDRIVGLELGADDYVAKPFNPRELLARLRAVLRRRGARASGEVLRFGRLEVDRDARAVRVDGEARPLTSLQFDLLWALARSAGRVLSRESLLERVHGDVAEGYDRTIDVHVSRIRAAIEDDPHAPRRILTVRGAGYVFARRQDE